VVKGSERRRRWMKRKGEVHLKEGGGGEATTALFEATRIKETRTSRGARTSHGIETS